MFAKAYEHAVTVVASKKKYPNDKEMKNGIKLHANIVGIIGQAGIGKTTLSKRILKDIIGPYNLFGSKYVFYLQFRDVDYEDDTNLLSFLTRFLPLSWITNDKRRNAVLQLLSKEPDVIVIMDGFDEAIMEVGENFPPLTHLFANEKPGVIIKNILRGSILGNAKKIVTSRPRQMLESNENIRPKYIVNILGLGLEEQFELCKNICEKNAEKVFNYIQQRPPIASLCQIPSNCINAMHMINEDMDAKYENRTITDLVAVMICLFVLTAQRRRLALGKQANRLTKIAKLAWNGFVQRKFRFTERELKHADISREGQSLFFVATLAPTSMTILTADTIFYFARFIIQEFFVALYLIFFTSPQEFNKVVSGKPIQTGQPAIDLAAGNWEMVTKFLYGICKSDTHQRLLSAFPDLASDVTERITSLRQFAKRFMPAKSVSDDSYFQTLLPVCIWAHELNIEAFASEIAQKLKKSVIVKGKVLPSDIIPFDFILLQRQIEIELDTTLYETCFIGGSLTHFLNAMEKYKGENSHIIVRKIFYKLQFFAFKMKKINNGKSLN